MEKSLFVLAIEQDRVAEFKEIDGSLQGMQSFVGGLIECVSLGDGYVLVCNEEGKMIDGLKPTVDLDGDTVYGNCFVTKTDNEGEFVSLNDNDVDLLLEYFLQPSEN